MFNDEMNFCIPIVPSCCVPPAQSQSLSLTNITITWDREECLSRNGESRHYSVYYRENGSMNAMMNMNVGLTDSGKHECNISSEITDTAAPVSNSIVIGFPFILSLTLMGVWWLCCSQ